MKYAIVTFGCRVNQADSLEFEEDLIEAGARPADSDDADLVVVNTCSVTTSADQGARQTIRRIARVNPDAKIVVTGCYATRCPDEVGELPNVVRVVRNPDKAALVGALLGGDDRLLTLTSAERFGSGDGSCGASIEPGVAGRTAFTLRVQTGCAEPCSYCIIPTTRGEPRSRPIAELLGEIDRVVAAGFKEIALTGVHLGSYGRDLKPALRLIDLLREMAARETRPSGDRVQFRISSLEPMDCTPEVVRTVAEHDCFASHFHLPLQHASDRMLAAMRRPYTSTQYSTLVDDIRRRIPHAAIGSDVIVGFPGETDRDFEQLALYLESCPLTHVHVFPYSDRPGTVAAALDDKVPGAIIRERARRVRDISAALARRFRAGQLGTVHRALTLEDGSSAVTGNYLKLRIPPGRVRNEWVNVRVVDDGRAEVLP
jgi:threonylcarbamoyladenosine tRNA methylthiotransferase MtaB